MPHTHKSLITTGHGSRSPIVTVRTEQFVHTIESAAADLRRGGLAVTHAALAQYVDMPEYLIRRVVEIQPAAEGKGA